MRCALALAGALLGCGESADDPAEVAEDAGEAPACQAEVIADEGHDHVTADTAVTYDHNPAASGPHLGRWSRSGIYEMPLDPRGWVHNLEHGWVVLLHGPEASAEAVAALEDLWTNPPEDPYCPDAERPRILVSPAPDLPSKVAAVAWTRVLSGDMLDRAALTAFFRDCRGAAGELRVCADGGEPTFR